MPVLFVLVADVAMREAVVEQIKAAKLGDVRILETAQACLKQAESEKPAALLIDEEAYTKKTFSALRPLAEAPEKPALLLLGDGGEGEGVSESFAKPIRLGHLMTRLRYHLETAPLLRDKLIAFGPYRLEAQNRRILSEKNAEPIRLTEKETALLVFLAQSSEPATRREILASIWGYDERIDTHTLETHIYQLRRKLDGDGENWLISEAGAYRLARGRE